MKQPRTQKGPTLTCLQPLDLDRCQSLDHLLESMSATSFGARQLGRAWSVLKDVVRDPKCTVILTVSGAMTVAKLGRVFGSLISRSLIHSVITTGAIVTHSLVEEVGMQHYQAPQASDETLLRQNLNRIYDSIEPEGNLQRLEKLVRRILPGLDPGAYGSADLIRYLSSVILRNKPHNGLLGSALDRGINVYAPALTDSELGLYLFRYYQREAQAGRNAVVFDPFKDLMDYANWIRRQRRVALLTIGGGVPRNWGQQMLPFLRSHRAATRGTRLPRVIAGVRICPDRVELGHLSGSTYSEALTWGKVDPASVDNFVEVPCDATIVFPILAKALMNHLSDPVS